MPCATERCCSGLAYTMHSTHEWCIATYGQYVRMFRDGEVLTNIWNVTCVCGGLVAKTSTIASHDQRHSQRTRPTDTLIQACIHAFRGCRHIDCHMIIIALSSPLYTQSSCQTIATNLV